jgi:hypothetical protein
MSSKDTSDQQWPDPKDYGLPYVEILPLKSTVSNDIDLKEETPEPIISETINTILINQVPIDPVPILSAAESPNPISAPKPNLPVPKSSSAWVWVVSLIAVVIFAIIIWQMSSEDNDSPVVIVEEVEGPEILQENIPINSDSTSASQVVENQLAEMDSVNSARTAIEKPETGTTIEYTGEATLVRIEAKADRPTYFIVVGSLPNEKMALEEYPQYSNRASTVYLILPYDEVRNHRLAIGSFTSFSKANEELERIKVDYTEALWILKY